MPFTTKSIIICKSAYDILGDYAAAYKQSMEVLVFALVRWYARVGCAKKCRSIRGDNATEVIHAFADDIADFGRACSRKRSHYRQEAILIEKAAHTLPYGVDLELLLPYFKELPENAVASVPHRKSKVESGKTIDLHHHPLERSDHALEPTPTRQQQ